MLNQTTAMKDVQPLRYLHTNGFKLNVPIVSKVGIIKLAENASCIVSLWQHFSL